MFETTRKFIPQVLSEYCQRRESGILVIKNGAVSKMIHFEDGKIIFASSSNPDEQFGAALVRWGKLQGQQLLTIKEQMIENRLRLTQMLISEFQFIEEDIPALFTRLVNEIIRNCFSWTEYELFFQPNELPDYEIKLQIYVPQTILEGIRTLENLIHIKRVIGDLQAPLNACVPITQIYETVILDPQEAFIISSLEQNSFSTTELVQLAIVPEEIVLKTVCALLQNQLIKQTNIIKQKLSTITGETPQLSVPQPVNASSSAPPLSPQPSSPLSSTPAPSTNRSSTEFPALDTATAMALCYDVENKIRSIREGLSCYELLEISTNASAKEAQAAYDRLKNHFHPDRRHQLAAYNLDLGQDLELICNVLTQALADVCNPPKQPPRQQEMMQFCYQVEAKLREIKEGSGHYRVLEVDRDARPEQIEAAYQKLKIDFSPDRQYEYLEIGLNIANQLLDINNALRKAHEILSNPYQRRSYDDQLNRDIRRSTASQPSQFANTNANRPNSPANNFNTNSRPTQPSPTYNTGGAPKSAVFPKANSNSVNNSNDPRFKTYERSMPPTPASTSTTNPSPIRHTPPTLPAIPAVSPQTRTTLPSMPAIPTPKATPSIPTAPPPAAPPRAPLMASPAQKVAQPFVPQPAPPAASSGAANAQNAAQHASTRFPAIGQNTKMPPGTTPPPYPQVPQNEGTGSDLKGRDIPGKKSKQFSATECYLKSIELYDQRKYEEAVEVLRQAVKLSPRDSEFWAQLGRTYNQIGGSQKQAEAAFMEAMELDPEDTDYVMDLAKSYMKNGLVKKAAEMYEKVLEIDPNNAAAQWALNEIPRDKPKQGLLARLGFGEKK